MNTGLDDREGFAAFLLRLRGRGTAPKPLVAAFEATPRRGFLSAQFHSIAWSDGMLPIECGEAIEGADLQAAVIGALHIEPGNRVLEIGTGSGYTAAVMSRLAARVITIDRYKTLTEQAKQRFEALAISNIIARQADGSNGLPNEGPFDRIVARKMWIGW
ncbi:methyltransferase domain-containing protein [Mesorhizobium sp. M00.F.Ca.ET.149.01.1.1]|nr:methyltransferase domain-containing protein [Mesorhizobium sp. M00.F.Ca.ET.149.01.1.1]